jgi:hypothetical protein
MSVLILRCRCVPAPAAARVRECLPVAHAEEVDDAGLAALDVGLVRVVVVAFVFVHVAFDDVYRCPYDDDANDENREGYEFHSNINVKGIYIYFGDKNNNI